MQFTILNILCLVTVFIAVVSDFYNRKIPNWLTMPATVVAVAIQGILYGMNGVIWGAAGWIVGVLLGVATKFGPKLLRRQYGASAIGFGDVKLIGTVGAFLGLHKIFFVFFFFCVFSGLHALIRVLTAIPVKSLLQAISYGLPIDSILKNEQKHINKVLQSQIPLAPSIALATVCTMVFFDSLLKFLGSK